MALRVSNFAYNASIMDVRVLNMPLSSKQCNIALAGAFSRRNGIRILPGRFHLKLQTGRPPSFQQSSRLLSLRSCQVTSEDSEGIEGILWEEQTLKQDLQTAIEEENYAQAAKIRDSLQELYEDSQSSILAANARFYDAFRRGDLAAMQTLWAKANNVCCVHPGASGISGYDHVMESWEVVWVDYDFPLKIELKDVRVHVRGNIGYVTCVEFVKTGGSSWGGQFVTNVFEMIDGQWFICIHHASPVDL
ncbi:UVR domain-containing protein/SnoaL_3 domain-containing protein [Cephalotus follicularis]|uniref:UVR domain-containing protein/SnoaL_3 domain-containing protein n=1 Tax=Cephalotus follicularis TaxID=3775 RepID=A0A1Q3BBX5_CEPFO|nr:UVR domain-containing protein/SnoaL_3 domain-containing protein [Cephalotus follicularis]